MELISLTPTALGISALLVLLLGLLSQLLHLGIGRRMIIAASRSLVQLLLLGMVLTILFDQRNPWLIGLITLVMLSVASREVTARQKHRYVGGWGYGIGALSMMLSSFSVTLLCLLLIIRVEPWYSPQYLIPLLGMLLGNTMSGVALSLDNLSQTAWSKRGEIEARLILGAEPGEAIREIRRDALRSGLIPIINSMSVAGVVSLPGMMTGQILGGTPPLEAAKYQILILLLIAFGTGLGSIFAVYVGARRLFDERQRLRLDRLRPARD
ncbi:MAG: iron export ABC transporter permease subunit FetB [Gammaproteobacteria bacterium]|nr:iron export ABC transporter permease subunit FetB [Gammaproteobacteria bacterium]MBU1655275.1 iron export ABC transporter permease subunit FetB [Gammaproteobacteria bacterium]MBU1962054.1 iron export ABC transporter permease subunit FetB [Gammaproteobacteria bacterium]